MARESGLTRQKDKRTFRKKRNTRLKTNNVSHDMEGGPLVQAAKEVRAIPERCAVHPPTRCRFQLSNHRSCSIQSQLGFLDLQCLDQFQFAASILAGDFLTCSVESRRTKYSQKGQGSSHEQSALSCIVDRVCVPPWRSRTDRRTHPREVQRIHGGQCSIFHSHLGASRPPGHAAQHFVTLR